MNDNTDSTETDGTDDAAFAQDEGRACEQDACAYQAYVAQLELETAIKAPKDPAAKTKKKTKNDD